MDSAQCEKISALPQKKMSKISKWVSDIARIAMLAVLALSFTVACKKDEGKNAENETKSTNIRKKGPLTGEINGHEWIDLGLPSGVKWATCNVGANLAEEYGNYFGWGETEPKDNYSSINSLTYKISLRKLKKAGIIDDTLTLTKEHDAANVQWGGTWRLPTDAEFEELISECNWSFATLNGVNGYLVVGPNKQSIFLPASAYQNGTTIENDGDFGDYWSSSLIEESSSVACSLGYSSKSFGRRRYARYVGRTVRPVSD